MNKFMTRAQISALPVMIHIVEDFNADLKKGRWRNLEPGLHYALTSEEKGQV